MDPKTLLECCRCARASNQEHRLPVGSGSVGVSQVRVIECCAMIQEELLELCDAAKAKMWGEFLLELTDVLYLSCNRTQKAGLETILSAAFSLQHAANVKKSYPNTEEALDRATQLLPNKKGIFGRRVRKRDS